MRIMGRHTRVDLEGTPNVFFLLDLHGKKVRLLYLRKKANQAAAIVARAERFYLAIAEQIGGLGEFLCCFECRRVVGLEIVTVGTVKHVNVPQCRMITLLDNLQRFDIAGRDHCAAGLALMEKLVFGDLFSFGVMRDENDFDVLITSGDKLIKEEEETAG